VKTRKEEGDPFPVQLGTADPDDLSMAIRKEAISSNANGVVPGMGQAIADDRVFDYLQRKKEAAIEADYRAWVMSQADFTDPAQSQWWTEKFPWIHNLKVQQIEQNAELQKRIAIIKVRGPQSEEDFKLMYEIQQGYKVIPEEPVHKMNEDKTWSNGDFVRGLFNPLTKIPEPNGFPKNGKIPSKWGVPFVNDGESYNNGNRMPTRLTNVNSILSNLTNRARE
jgi:hypothetical protein